MSSSSEQPPIESQYRAKASDESRNYSSLSDHGASEPVRPSRSNHDGANFPEAPQLDLRHPPVRSRPTTPAGAVENSLIHYQQPIPPPSEPMQYRAIGLVKGRYVPSERQLNRGILSTQEGSPVEAVLLGRVISLVKKHLDLEKDYLWVVYPRTRESQAGLHLQILGVWEPEQLSQDEPPQIADASLISSPTLTDGYFSIRGEVVYQSPEHNCVVVKIRQSPRKDSEQEKSFKLKLEGVLPDRAVGYFWNLEVHRQQDRLQINQASAVAIVPPKKVKKLNRGERPVLNQQRKFAKPVRTHDAKSPEPKVGGGRQVERPNKPIKRSNP